MLLANATAHNLKFKCRTRKVGQTNEKTAAATGRAVPNALAAFVKRPQSGLQIGAAMKVSYVTDSGNVEGQVPDALSLTLRGPSESKLSIGHSGGFPGMRWPLVEV